MVYGEGRKPREPGDEVFRKIFVGGLDFEVTTEAMCEYFAKFGEVIDCIVVKNPNTQRSKGFGFVTFKEPETVDAVQDNRPHVIQNKEVEVKRAMPRDESDQVESHVTTKKLFVGSLRRDATEEDLVTQFAQFGNVASAEIARVKESGESRGFGFVTFTDYDSVDKAMLHRPHSVKSSLVDVRKGLSKEEMQKVRMRQQYQQQQQHQPYYPQDGGYYGYGGPPGGFGFYGDQGGYGGGPMSRGGGASGWSGGGGAAAGGSWQRMNPYRGGGGGGFGGYGGGGGYSGTGGTRGGGRGRGN